MANQMLQIGSNRLGVSGCGKLFCLGILMTGLVVTPDTILFAQSIVQSPLRERSEVEDDPQELITVLEQEGRHYEALLKHLEMGGGGSVVEQLAAARSAWALSLPHRARQIWKNLLDNPLLSVQERARVHLAQAIVELQEHQPRAARELAELGTREIAASDLRAQLWMVMGESYREERQYSTAAGYYERALEEGSSRTRGEAHYLLGISSFQQKELDAARRHFTAVESTSHYAPLALRQLIAVEIQQGRAESALMWLTEGRDIYPEMFSDAWSGYIAVRALSQLRRVVEAEQEMKNLRTQYGAQSTWTVLAEGIITQAALTRDPHTTRRDESLLKEVPAGLEEARAQLSMTSAMARRP